MATAEENGRVNSGSVYPDFKRESFLRNYDPTRESFGEGSPWLTIMERILVQFRVSLTPGFIYTSHLFIRKVER